jgi:AsmA protein
VAAPVELVRDRLIGEVKARTGRDLVVSGSTSLLLVPRPAISLGNVALSAPPGMGGGPTLLVQALEAELSLASLLTGQAGIQRLVLFRPKIELKVDSQGRRSWDFARAAPSSSAWAANGEERWQLMRVAAPGAPVMQAQPTGGGNLASMLEKLAPLNLALREGSLHYVDERSGMTQDLTKLDIDVILDEGAGPVQANGSFMWRDETVTVAGDVASLAGLLGERATRLSLKLSGRPIEVHYDGKVEVGSELALQGNLDLKSPSLQALGAWADNKPLAATRNAGALTLSSTLTGESGRVALSDLTGTLGASALSGDLTIEARSARPYVTGSLKLSELDLSSILIRPANADPGPASSGRPAQPGAVRTGPQVRGFTQRTGGGADWSDEVIDPAPLTLADADLTLAADRLLFKDVTTGPVRLSLALADSVARLTLQEMLLYEGRGRGVATLDGRGQVPAISVNMLLEGISAQPLLKDALGFEWLEGRSTLTVALAGQGASERQIVATLGGKIDLATTGGTIDAIDVGKILRGLGEGRFTGLRVAQGEKTPFSELAGSFTIANGIADNQDLRLVSPNLRVSGAGSFNLPQRTLDYTVRPKVASLNAATDRAVINLSNVEVPVHIDGSWDKPNFSLAGQEQIVDTVKQIGKNLKSPEVQDAIKGLLGEDGQQKVKPRDVLEKLLKKQ